MFYQSAKNITVTILITVQVIYHAKMLNNFRLQLLKFEVSLFTSQ